MNSDTTTTQFNDVSTRTAALIAGLGLLLMAILAPFANFYVLGNLVVANDAKATTENIMASSGLFRLGIVGFLTVAVLDVLVAWALHILLEPVSRNLSLLAAWFRLLYAAVFALALSPLLGILQLLSAGESLKGLEAGQLHAQVMLSVGAFRYGWDLSLVLFGFHLLVLGYVVFRSGFMPKWLGVLLGIAALGYLADSFGKFLVPNYNITVAAFTFVGEVVLIFWLLWKGVIGLETTPRARAERPSPAPRA